MKGTARYFLYFTVILTVLIAMITLGVKPVTGSDAADGQQGTDIDPGLALAYAQPVPAGIRIRSDTPLAEPTVVPVMAPMPGMGPASAYPGMQIGLGSMGMGAGSMGYDTDYLMGSMGSMAGMGMGCCPMGGMGMAGGSMGYGTPSIAATGYDSYRYNVSYPGYGYPGETYAYGTPYANGSYPWQGGMIAYGGYPAGVSAGSQGSMPAGGCGGGSYGMQGYPMGMYGYNSTGYPEWPYGPMMGQGGYGSYGMMGGWNAGFPVFGIFYQILVFILLISWTILAIVASVYLIRKMDLKSRP